MSLPEAKVVVTPPAGLEFTRTISYIFDNPNWLMNLVWLFLCWLVSQVIPILPQMVATGYQFEVLDGLMATGGSRYPDFNVNRILDYLVRGLWPILAFMVVFVAWTLFFLVYVAVAVLSLVAIGNATNEGVVLIGVGIAVFVGLLLIALLMLVGTPVVLGSGMTGEFGAAFDMGWISSFVAKVWLQIILATLFLCIVSLAIVFVTCGLGLLVLFPISSFMATHFYFQLYLQFLARGGRPLHARMIPMTAQLAH